MPFAKSIDFWSVGKLNGVNVHDLQHRIEELQRAKAVIDAELAYAKWVLTKHAIVGQVPGQVAKTEK